MKNKGETIKQNNVPLKISHKKKNKKQNMIMADILKMKGNKYGKN